MARNTRSTKASTTKASEIVTQATEEAVESKEVNIESASAKDLIEMAKNGEIKEEEEKLREVITNTTRETQQAKPTKVYDQHEPILCRSVTPGWLGMTGKSGVYYVWNNTGDVCEVEYGDLWSIKASRSQYLYKPYFIIEDEELLEQPRWKDLKAFYEDKVYGLDNVDAILNVPSNVIRKVLTELSDGMKKAVAMRATSLAERGELDSIKKIKIIDEVCGTDILSILAD